MKRNVQLYIAGQLVDLADDSWILYNWTREEMSNPTAVINSSSHQVTLPGTCRNNGVFGAAFRLDRRTLFGIRYDGTEFDPTRKTPFMLYDSDGTVLESGYCRLDAVNTHNRRHAYTVTLYGGLGSFFYALASKDDGTPRTLADLIWADMDGEDVTDFEAFPSAGTVQDAWTYLGGGEPERKTWWNVLNFAPCYNGLPADFDASHAVMRGWELNTVPDGYGNLPAHINEGDPHVRPPAPESDYTYKPGLDCALISFTNPHTEWEMGDLRWYLQRPVVSVKAFIAAVCDPRNNGGYEVTLDPTFFNDTNPYYADAWWTLGMIATEDRASSDCLNNVLRASKTPMRYLADFAKHFGLVFMWDSSRHKVSIVTRATFYDLTVAVPRQPVNLWHVTMEKKIINASGSVVTNNNFDSCQIQMIPGHTYNVVQEQVASAGNVVRIFKYSNGGYTQVWYKQQNGGTVSYTCLDDGDTYILQGVHDRRSTTVGLTEIYDHTADSQPQYVPAAPVDLSGRIDRSQEIVTDPVLADKRWYQLGNGGKGEFVEKYKADYGKDYATQRIDTGYEFDAGTTILTDGMAFQEAAEVLESSLMFASVIISGRAAHNYFLLPKWETVNYELWANGESKSFEMECQPEITDYFNSDNHFADRFPKVQLHGPEHKAQDGADVLVFFGGFETGGWFLTDDSDAMTDLAGGPCWDLTRTGIQRTSLPSFRRNVLSGRYIVNSWEWGAPAARPVPDIQFPDGAPTALYDLWWKAYLADRYATDTAVMTCRVDLRGLPVGQALLRRFYWYDGALWTLNAIRNHPLTSWDLTECEFVRVQDKLAYTEGPGALSAHFLDITPSAASFQVKSRGEVLTLTVRSSSAWTLDFSAIQNWLVASADTGDAGTTVITLTAVGNDSSARRSVGVTVTNTDGITRQFNVIQPPKTAGSLSLSPSSLTINSGGTGLRGASSRVTADGAWAVDDTTVESWLRYNVSSAGITVYCDGNGGSARSSYIKVYLTGDPDTYAILAVTQEAGAGGTGGITLTDGQGNTSATVQSSGGSLTLVLTIPEGDDWTLTKDANWVTVSPVSGAGNNNAIAVTIPSYSGSSDRQATITAKRDGYTEGAVFYIIQAAPAANPDYIKLTRADAPLFNNVEVDGNGGTLPFDVRASGDWSVAAQSSWLHPLTQYGAWSGSGNATLWFSCDANSGSPRTGTIVGTHAVTGETSTFYVYQSGDGTVSLSASFNYSTIDSTAQRVYLTIVCPSGLAWSIDNVSNGLAPDSLSGTGPATIGASVTANTGSSPRTLSLRVKNTMYSLTSTASVNQNPPAATDYLRVTPFGDVRVLASATYQDFAVECSTSWQVTTNVTGVTITPSSGSGNGTVRVSFPANTSSSIVSIPLTFQTTSGTAITKTATIKQSAASSATISVTPTSLDIDPAGETKTVAVTASDPWVATKSASWITLSDTSGSAGSGIQVGIGAAANNGNRRTGTVSFQCGHGTPVVVTVTQEAQSRLDVDTSAVALDPASGSTGAVTVYASGPWAVISSLPSWLEAIAPSKNGSAQGETLTFRAKSQNNDTSTRTATVRIALDVNSGIYVDITVSQAGQTYIYVSPFTASVPNTAGSGYIHVDSNTAWEIVTLEAGIDIDAQYMSGSGSMDIPYSYDDNTGGEFTATVTFETTDGKSATFTLIQAATDTPIVVTPNRGLVFGTDARITTEVRVIRANASWSLSSSGDWLRFSPSSGAANTDVNVTFYGLLSETETFSAVVTITTALGDTLDLAADSFPPLSND